MGFLGFGKKDRVIDLAAHYRKKQEREAQDSKTLTSSTSSDSGGGFGFFGSMANAASPSNTDVSVPEGILDLTSSVSSSESVNPAERKRKLAKRLIEMTEKMEDLNNQIYHLQQRVELLERKSGM